VSSIICYEFLNNFRESCPSRVHSEDTQRDSSGLPPGTWWARRLRSLARRPAHQHRAVWHLGVDGQRHPGVGGKRPHLVGVGGGAQDDVSVLPEEPAGDRAGARPCRCRPTAPGSWSAATGEHRGLFTQLRGRVFSEVAPALVSLHAWHVDQVKTGFL
jgi:hypothetical protein